MNKRTIFISLAIFLLIVFIFRERIYYTIIFDKSLMENHRLYADWINNERQNLGEPPISEEDIELDIRYIGNDYFTVSAFADSDLLKPFVIEVVYQEGFFNYYLNTVSYSPDDFID